MSLYISFECESCENENCTGKGLKSTVYKCGGYKHKQTNADRIRSMTDEELAELFWIRADCELCPNKEPHCSDDCKKHWLDWLRQEANHND